MFVTVSFRNFTAAIREGQNLDPSITDDELAVTLDRHSQRLWAELAQFGIKFEGLAEHTSAVAAFKISIAGIGTDFQTGAFNFQKLNDGLAYIRPTAITVEET